ncbi:MAG: hypothetical protein ACOC44_16430 [Promethearchaeia archaeon]
MNDRQRTVSTMTYSHVEGKGFSHAKAMLRAAFKSKRPNRLLDL